MSTSPQAEISVQVTSLNPNYKQSDLTMTYCHECAHQHMPQQEPELDLEHVNVCFRLVKEKMSINDQGASVLMKIQDAKKLNLMVGDLVTIRLTKTMQ
jgi:hypothetical protein